MHSAVHTVVRFPSVRLSVSLSVALVYYFETTELIVKQLALDCSHGTLVYGQHMERIFREPVIGASNRRKVSKSCDVTQIFGYISKTTR